jgi:SAM-dependent methyltransferase
MRNQGVISGDESEAIRETVRERYGDIGSGRRTCCGSAESSSCCGSGKGDSCCESTSTARNLGYAPEDLVDLPTGSNLGLGCGNPTALLSLKPGEVVLDLGGGGGVDCFIAAKRVGLNGRVTGVDMTPEMDSRARENARKGGYSNVEFRLGEIEHLPVEDESVDVVISNCVINLAPDKGQVYREAFRVLRPGGRVSFSDVVATRPIPKEFRKDSGRWSSCSSGALSPELIESLLKDAGFRNVRIEIGTPSEVTESLAAQEAIGVLPATIRAVRPPES